MARRFPQSGPSLAAHPWAPTLRIDASPVLALPLFIGLSLWLRWPTFFHPIWNVDETIHAAIARLLMDGGVLYRDAVDIRHPLTYYLFAGVFSVFGANALWAVRMLVAVMIGLTGWSLFRCGQAIRSTIGGVMAGLAYVCLATGALYQGDANAAHTEWFVAFFSAAAAVLFLCGGTPPGPRRLFFAGILYGGSFLSKQPALLDLAAPLIGLAYAAWQGVHPLRRTFASLAWLLAGWAAPVLAAIIYFAASGALKEAVFYGWTYNLSYYGPEITSTGRLVAAAELLHLLELASPGWLFLALASGATLIVRLLQLRPTREEAERNGSLAFVLAWTAAGLAGAASSGRSFDHYLIQMLAPFCLLAAWMAATWMQRSLAWRRWAGYLTATVVLAILGTIGWKAASARTRTLPPDASAPIADYIRAHSSSTDRIFVWGFQPDIYLEADRRPASRFVIASFLTGLIPWTNVAPGKDTRYAIVPGTMDELLSDLERTRPRYIVDCSVGPNRHWDKYPPQDFPRFSSYLQSRYLQEAAEQFLPRGFRLYRLKSAADDTAASGPATTELSRSAAVVLKLAVQDTALTPLRASAPYGVDASRVDSRIEYFMHAPSTLEYRLPEAAARVHGGFGIRPAAYAPENKGPTDGAEFVIRWIEDGGSPRVLFRQLLRPLTVPADRGTQAFSVDLPSDHRGGMLKFEIRPGPADNNASDWTYWSDLTLEKYR